MTDESLVEAPQQSVTQDVETPPEPVNSDEEGALQGSQEPVVEESNKTPEWVQRRFNEMTRERHEANRKAEAAINEAATYRRLMESMQQGKEIDPNQPAPQQRPQASDDDRIRAEAQRLNQTESFNNRCNAVYETGKTDFPNFEDAVKNLGMLGAPLEFFEGVVGLEDAHKVLYALGSNPDEASRILALPPLQQGRELERLAAKARAKTAKPVSNAPAPISNTVDGSGRATKDLDKMSIDEFMAARNSKSR